MSKQYSVKVYPAGRGRDVYRNIEICGNESLDRLCRIILEAFCRLSGQTDTCAIFGGQSET